MSSVYRTKADVPPDPPDLRILSVLYRLRPMGRQREAVLGGHTVDLAIGAHDAPPARAPIWCQLEPYAGLPPPQHVAHGRARARTGTAVTAIGAFIVVSCWLVLAMVGYRKYLRAAHESEAVAMVHAVRAAEEVHRAETLGYLGCGQCEGGACDQVQGSLLARYPHQVPGEIKWSWSQPSHPDFACWQQLAVSIDGPVRYAYAVVAGPAGVSPPPIPGLAHQPAWPTPTGPWYVVQAIGDVDGDGVQSIVVGSSFSAKVYAENEGE